MNTSQNLFKPLEYRCFECETNIHSSYSGDFTRCKCGKCFVDQTDAYIRIGGNAKLIGDYEP